MNMVAEGYNATRMHLQYQQYDQGLRADRGNDL